MAYHVLRIVIFIAALYSLNWNVQALTVEDLHRVTFGHHDRASKVVGHASLLKIFQIVSAPAPIQRVPVKASGFVRAIIAREKSDSAHLSRVVRTHLNHVSGAKIIHTRILYVTCATLKICTLAKFSTRAEVVPGVLSAIV